MSRKLSDTERMARRKRLNSVNQFKRDVYAHMRDQGYVTDACYEEFKWQFHREDRNFTITWWPSTGLLRITPLRSYARHYVDARAFSIKEFEDIVAEFCRRPSPSLPVAENRNDMTNHDATFYIQALRMLADAIEHRLPVRYQLSNMDEHHEHPYPDKRHLKVVGDGRLHMFAVCRMEPQTWDLRDVAELMAQGDLRLNELTGPEEYYPVIKLDREGVEIRVGDETREIDFEVLFSDYQYRLNDIDPPELCMKKSKSWTTIARPAPPQAPPAEELWREQ